jgi:hypothetical protein
MGITQRVCYYFGGLLIVDETFIIADGGQLSDWEAQSAQMQLPAYGRHSKAGCLANHINRKASIYAAKKIVGFLREQDQLADKFYQAADRVAADLNDEDALDDQAIALANVRRIENRNEQFFAFIEAL